VSVAGVQAGLEKFDNRLEPFGNGLVSADFRLANFGWLNLVSQKQSGASPNKAV
jgi:hypothetical protein